jgi:hypothetical protein
MLNRPGVKIVSKYTTEVRYICESMAGNTESKGYNDVDTIISQAVPKIFNFDYPIFDENYRVPLEKKILESYYTREIAHETVGLWRLKLQTKLRQIMPYYNQMYKSTLFEFNPLYDVDVTHNRTVTNNGTKITDGTTVKGVIKKETGTVTNDGTTTNTGTVHNGGTVKDTGTVVDANTVTRTITGSDTDAYNDTPQGGIADVENNTYLTNYRKKSNTNTETDKNDNTRTND